MTLSAGLVGVNFDTIMSSYGFGDIMGAEITSATNPTQVFDRSGDASSVSTASRLTRTNSGWSTGAMGAWDFGTAGQNPALQWVTSYSGTTYSCVENLIPDDQDCFNVIRGQPRTP